MGWGVAGAIIASLGGGAAINYILGVNVLMNTSGI